jgi:hypothetical protein
MPKIIFWNIARLGKGKKPVGAEELNADLEGLTGTHNPEVVVICEGLKGLRKAMKQNQELPSGYHAPKFIKTHGNYQDVNTLRYVVFARVNCSCYLIGTGNDRPALVICFGGQCVMALHAPSVTSSTTPQTDQMKSAYATVTQLVNTGKIGNAVNPCLIFGDLNMNLRDGQKQGKIRAKLMGTGLQHFSIADPGVPTHRNQQSGLYDTTLDWALEAPGTNATVSVIEAAEEMSLEWNSDDDDDFVPQFENTKNPDHKPILISW